MKTVVLALLQTTAKTDKSPLLLVFGLAMLVGGFIGLRTAVLMIRGDGRAWGSDRDVRFPRTINIGAWLYGLLLTGGGIASIVAFLAG